MALDEGIEAKDEAIFCHLSENRFESSSPLREMGGKALCHSLPFSFDVIVQYLDPDQPCGRDYVDP
jgi:hypothetical protein